MTQSRITAIRLNEEQERFVRGNARQRNWNITVIFNDGQWRFKSQQAHQKR
jgi:hypothetical protein